MNATENINTVIQHSTADLSFFSMIKSADTMSKLIMLILLIASVWSWTIIIDKLLVLKKIKKRMAEFESVFWSGQILEQLFDATRKNIDNPLSNIFVNAMTEFKRHNFGINNFSVISGFKERILQTMNITRDREIESLEKHLDVLSIIGSNALFIGLFGTVWGIMHSFQSIAGSKNTSLAVVAPGIAEALLATAIGLLAAVPSVIFYTYLCSKIDKIYNKMEEFTGELYNILSRAIDEGK